MNVPVWAIELAARYWSQAGSLGPSPRDLSPSVSRALPLVVVGRAGLRLSEVEQWLADLGIGCPAPGRDRRLRGCLIAARGCGFVFVDNDDDPAEQRFTVAHEVAHYLRDYQQPREEAVRRLGERAREVLDGQRAATLEERLHSALAHVPLGFHTHLLSAETDAVEEEADLLACELLAPARLVLEQTGSRSRIERLLREEFGLPPAQAARHARRLVPPAPPRNAMLLRLFPERGA